MRNKLICFVVFSLLVLGFVACNKDEKEDITSQKMIEKITIFENQNESVNNKVYRFQYDGNRLTEIYQDVNISYTYVGGSSIGSNKRKYSFKYDGELLKMIEIDGSSKEFVSLLYNSEGQLNTIESGTNVLEITWRDGYPVAIGNDKLTWHDGDLRAIDGERKDMRFTYDVNASPFNLSMNNRIVMMYLGGWSYDFGFACNMMLGINPSAHNVTEEQTRNSGNIKRIYEYKYTKDGYPLSTQSYNTDGFSKGYMRYVFYTYTDGDGAEVPKNISEIKK